MKPREVDNLGFYSWCCITLRLKRRDVDLVIKDEKQLSIFLKFLIYSLKTTDGIKNTASNLLHKMTTKKSTISNPKPATELKLIDSNQDYVFEKIHMKYKIL